MKKMIFLFILVLGITFIFVMIKQPLYSQHDFKFTLQTHANESTLQKHVKYLSELNRTTKEGQEKVVKYILNELDSNEISKENISIQTYIVKNREYKNIIVKFGSFNKGIMPKDKYILGAHYDSFGELPGADDNASGVAGLLEAARILSKQKDFYNRHIELVFYSTEEPPFFGTENMGSYHHAKNVKDDQYQKLKLVMVYDMIGYFSEEENSQEYPIPAMKAIYPSTGNYISLVSNFSNSAITRKIKKKFKSFLKGNNFIGVQSVNGPRTIPGVDFSDHRNYWKFGFSAILITDTAFYRNKNYHSKNDTYEKLNYKKMKEVVDATIMTLLSL